MTTRAIFFEVGGWLIMACLALIVVLLFFKLIQRFRFIFRALDYLTMPGAIFHELGHYLCCKAHGVHVFRVDWFHWGYMLNRERASRESENRLGAVWQARTPNILVQFQISTAPLLSCGLCWLIAVVGLHLVLSETLPFNAALHPALETIVIIILLWIGLASADRMLPSEGDMKNVLKFKERDPISVTLRALARAILAINKLLYRYINGVPAWGALTSLVTLYVLLRFSIPGGQAYLEPIGIIATAIRDFAEAAKEIN